MLTEERKQKLKERIEQTKKVLEITRQSMDGIWTANSESHTILCFGEVGKRFDLARSNLREAQKLLVIAKYDDELELMS